MSTHDASKAQATNASIVWYAAAFSVVAWGLLGFALHHIQKSAPDLAAMFIAARLIRAGMGAHIYDHDPEYFDLVSSLPWFFEAERINMASFPYPYVYAPLWAAVLAPIVDGIDFSVFRAAITAVNVAALGSVILIAAQQWAPAFLRPAPLLLVVAAAFLSVPVIQGILLGQVQPIVILSIVIAMAASQNRRPALAGAALALASALKILPAVLAIYWALTGRRDSAAWFGAIAAMLALMSLALAGWDIHLTFLDTLQRVGRSLVFALANQSLPAWLGHFDAAASDLFTARIYPVPGWIPITSVSIAVIVSAATIAAARTTRLNRNTDAAAMAVMVLAATITAPIAWSHYYAFLLVPALLLAQSGNWLAACAVGALVCVPLHNFGVALIKANHTILAWNELAAGLICVSALLAQILAQTAAHGWRRLLSTRDRENGSRGAIH
jgi:hypothetical protein